MAEPQLGAVLRPNADVRVYWESGTEDHFTNDRGWRVASKTEQSGSRRLMIAGCSWAQGVGLSYEATIAGHLQQGLNSPAANVGVGSYGLIQVARRVVLEARVAKPDLILIVYGHWLVDRCVKLYALGETVLRPIFRRDRSSDDLVLVEPRFPPESWLELNRQIGRREQAKGGISILDYNRLRALKIGTLIRNGFMTRYVRARLGLRNDLTIDPRSDRARDDILEYCLHRLDETAASVDAQVILANVDLPKVMTDQSYATYSRAENDRLDKIASQFTRIRCVGYNQMIGRYKNSLESASQGHEAWDASLMFPDHNHLNHEGAQLVAEGILADLKDADL